MNEKQILIANDILSRLSSLKIRILANLIKMCPIIGHNEQNGAPIKKPCKLSTNELCNIIKACPPIMFRELRELEEGGIIARKHKMWK